MVLNLWPTYTCTSLVHVVFKHKEVQQPKANRYWPEWMGNKAQGSTHYGITGRHKFYLRVQEGEVRGRQGDLKGTYSQGSHCRE